MKEIAADIAAEEAAPDKTEDVTVTLKTRTVPDLSETPDGNLSEQERTAKREQTQIKAEMETLGVYNSAEQAKPDFLEINMEKTVSGASAFSAASCGKFSVFSSAITGPPQIIAGRTRSMSAPRNIRFVRYHSV